MTGTLVVKRLTMYVLGFQNIHDRELRIIFVDKNSDMILQEMKKCEGYDIVP